ncbi:MAG: hypothetical protein ACRDEA_04950 [Microcystaceae cyanobacterium]
MDRQNQDAAMAVGVEENSQHTPIEKGERGGVESSQSVDVLQTDLSSEEASCSEPSFQSNETDNLQRGALRSLRGEETRLSSRARY